MSAPKNTIVHRNYQLEPDYCAQALSLLLKTPARNKEGGPDNRPDDRKGPEHDPASTTSIH